MNIEKDPGSFRDKSGFVYHADNAVYRTVNAGYENEYNLLLSSGLYASLTGKQWLIKHKETDLSKLADAEISGAVSKLLEVEFIPFISYPYQWCFEQLKDAALLTLDIQMEALEHGMILKDASAFNVQFYQGKPVFIDTLSFAIYKEGEPWSAYRQFCMHFLAPLALMKYISPSMNRMLEIHLDGIPLPLVSSLLPYKTRFSAFYQMHIHYHAKLENKFSGDEKAAARIRYNLSKAKLRAIISHLRSGIKAMELPAGRSEWSDYYSECSYEKTSIEHKKQLVLEWVKKIKPLTAWDLGANTGVFSELLQPVCENIIAFDLDHLAVQRFYKHTKGKGYTNILSLNVDLTNPTHATGWANRERKSFMQQGPADVILALALIHHLIIGNNVSFPMLSQFFASLTKWLVIEFIPKSDPQVKRLLVTRPDIYDDYTNENFEKAFSAGFQIHNKELITGTDRILYLMEKRS